MTESTKEKEGIGRWSLDRIRFLLGHIEGFIDDEQKDIHQRAGHFTPADGLDKIEKLVDGDLTGVDVPARVLERLAVFFEAGLLIQRSPNVDSENWWVTDLFWRGTMFHVDLKDQA